MASYVYPKYAWSPPPELSVPACAGHTYPVVIVGAGLVGLTLALDLALKDVPVCVLDEDDTVSVGSRSICQAQRTLEIWHRLGVADRMVAKGVTWTTGDPNTSAGRPSAGSVRWSLPDWPKAALAGNAVRIVTTFGSPANRTG